MPKLSLYFYTVRYMKPSQIRHRIRKMTGRGCSFGCVPGALQRDALRPPHPLEELDFDPVFLARFSADDLLDNKVTFLHEESVFRWNESWKRADQSDLWNFNLHYFEYLYVLLDAWHKSNRREYLDQARCCVTSWITENPKEGGGFGWSPYTIALRLTVWMECYAELTEAEPDNKFREMFLCSMHEQYVFLAGHLEKDLLGNHSQIASSS